MRHLAHSVALHAGFRRRNPSAPVDDGFRADRAPEAHAQALRRRSTHPTHYRCKRNGHAPACQQGRHHLRGDRLDPHPDHVGRAADHAGSDRRAGRRRRNSRRRYPAFARARPQRRASVARSGGVHAVSSAHQTELRRDHQHHDRRQRHHDGRGADRRRIALLAGNVLAQYGLDEFCPLSNGAAL